MDNKKNKDGSESPETPSPRRRVALGNTGRRASLIGSPVPHRRGSLGGDYSLISAAQDQKKRSEAVEKGIPPFIVIATQISTLVYDNIVVYRGSDPIPTALYNDTLTGIALPKPLDKKEKTSVIGPQEGRLALEKGHQRYARIGDDYQLVPIEVDAGEIIDLKIPLKAIYEGWNMGKYQLLNGDKIPKDGLLLFSQVNIESDQIKNIIYRINLNEAENDISLHLNDRKLLENIFTVLRSNSMPSEDSVFYNRLDKIYTLEVKHAGDNEFNIMKTKKSFVRDCDINYITVNIEKCKSLLGIESMDRYLDPVEMNDQPSKDAMYQLLVEINDKRWSVFESASPLNYLNMPLVPKDLSIADMALLVGAVGKGSAFELYQALEINTLGWKIIELKQYENNEFKQEDLFSSIPEKRYLAMKILLEYSIDLKKYPLEKSFLQHPGECFNEKSTSKRGMSVAISGSNIISGDDYMMSSMLIGKTGYAPINPQWIAENSQGNTSDIIWVKHILLKFDDYKNQKELLFEVDNFIKRDLTRIADLFEGLNPESSGHDYLKKMQHELTHSNSPRL